MQLSDQILLQGPTRTRCAGCELVSYLGRYVPYRDGYHACTIAAMQSDCLHWWPRASRRGAPGVTRAAVTLLAEAMAVGEARAEHPVSRVPPLRCVDDPAVRHLLMILNQAGPVARERALVKGRPLYVRRSGDFANAQIGAIMERLETDWMRRLELEQMAQ